MNPQDEILAMDERLADLAASDPAMLEQAAEERSVAEAELAAMLSEATMPTEPVTLMPDAQAQFEKGLAMRQATP